MDNQRTASNFAPCGLALVSVTPPAGLSFLNEMTIISPAGHSDILLLQACYHLHHFCEALFDDFVIPFPAHLNKAVKKRRAEYLASRVCVRYALQRMGIDDFVLSNDAERAPVWPDNIIGSLSHTHQHISLLLAHAASGKLLGIDCEQVLGSNTAEEMQEMIISAEEKAVLQQSGLPFATALTVAFSVKESLYKAIFPCLRAFMDFTSAEIINFTPGANTILLRLTRSFSADFPAGRLFTGHIQLTQDEVLSWIVTPPGQKSRSQTS